MSTEPTTRFVPEPGYTPIPDVLFDEYLLECTGSEWQVLTMIARMTFGWGVEERLLKTEELAELTGLSRQSVSTALKGLLGKGMIGRRHHQANQWLYGIPVKKLDAVKKLGSPKSLQPLSKSDARTNNRSTTKKRNIGANAPPVKKTEARKQGGARFKPDPTQPVDAVIVELFEDWVASTPQPDGTSLTNARAGQIRARLREQAEGVPSGEALAVAAERLREGLQGWYASDWHRDRGAFDFDTFFRSRGKVDMFRGRGHRETQRKTNGRNAEYDAHIERGS